MKKVLFSIVMLASTLLSAQTTLSVADAIALANNLEANATTNQTYVVEGYVVNAESFHVGYGSQTFNLSDNPTNTGNQVFKGYTCVAIENGEKCQVLNGDKIQLSGKITRYHDATNNRYIPEIKNGVATFIDKASGDHSIPSTVEITVFEALDRGWNVESSEEYEITGYVTYIDDNSYSTIYNNMCFWIADKPGESIHTNAEGALYVYRGKPNKELAVGDRVRVYSQIIKFGSSNPVIEAKTGARVVCENPILIGNIYYVLDTVENTATISYPGFDVGDMSIDEVQSYTLEVPNDVVYNGMSYPVTGISDYAFYNKRIYHINIGENITKIGSYAFAGTWLNDVNIPNSVQSVGGSAFSSSLRNANWGVASQADYENIVVEDDRVVVSLDASNLTWNDVYLYAWDASNNKILNDWPGTLVTPDNNGRYTYSFPKSRSAHFNIIWNNGVDQSRDITHVRESSMFKLDSNTGTKISYSVRQIGRVLSPFVESKRLQLFTLGSDVVRVPGAICTGMENLTEIDIPLNVVEIGKSAFLGCTNVSSISLGENVKTYGNYAFANCPNITSIYNYRKSPARLGTGTFQDVDVFECTLYVLASSINMYKSSGSDWKDFYFVEPIVGTEATVTKNSVTVDADEHTALFTWPINNNATSYSLQITKENVVFCTLEFNASGQLTGIAFAPSRDRQENAPAATTSMAGMSFTVTGLSGASKYAYRLAALDEQNNELIAYSGEFATIGYEGEITPGGDPENNSEGIDQIVNNPTPTIHKLLRDGQIHILRGDKTYTVTGQEVK